jgi:hypothetical protein
MGRMARGDAEERSWVAVCASLMARYEALAAQRRGRAAERSREPLLVGASR